jgi:hypothetical protein
MIDVCDNDKRSKHQKVNQKVCSFEILYLNMVIFNINIRNWIQNILKPYFENIQTSIEFMVS